MVGKDLAKEVSCTETYEWTEGEWELGKGFVTPDKQPYHVVAYDFGVKPTSCVCSPRAAAA